MDFWDVAKLLARRWYVTAPLLLLTFALPLVLLTSTRPDYRATVNVAFVGGHLNRPIKDGQPTLINPWTPESMADAARIGLESKSVHDSIEAAGFIGDWTTTISEGDLASIRIDVVAPTAAQATVTANRLVSMLDEEVKQRQVPLRLTAGELISTQQIEPAPVLETTRSKTIRVAVAMAAASLVVTVAFGLGVDAIARRRARRRIRTHAGVASVSSTSTALPGTVHRGISTGSDETVVFHRVTAADPPALVLPSLSASLSSPAPTSPAPASPTPAGRAGGGQADVDIEYRSASYDVEDDGTAPEDSTIVLPLSNAPGWRAMNGGKPAGSNRP
jgi:hypothetical protein